MVGEEYGRLVELDIDAIHSGTALGFPRAWATLCVQCYMARELRNIVHMIVAGAQPTGDLKWTKMVSDGLHSSAGGARWGVYDNQAFAPPSKFDPEVLLEMARDQLNRIADEVELLQSDPGYMREYVLNMKANISWDSGISSSPKWSYIASNIITLWTHKLSRWQIIFDKSRELVALTQTHRTAIEMCSKLPKDVEAAIVNYGAMIKDTMELQLLHLHLGMTEMHATKEVFIRREQNGGFYRESRYNKDFTKVGDRIVFATIALLNKMPWRHMTRGTIGNLSAELSKARFDKLVDEALSTVTLLDTMRLIWFSGHLVPHNDLCSLEKSDEAARERVVDLCAQHCRPFNQQSFEKQYPRLGSLLRDFYECLWPKNRCAPTWLEKMADARRLQTSFWQSAREHWKKHEQALESNIVDAVVSYMSFDSSPRYLAELDEERAAFEAEVKQRMHTEESPKRPGADVVQSVWGDEPEPTKIMRQLPSQKRPDRQFRSS